MTKDKNKERCSIVLDREDKKALLKMAEKEERSLNYIIGKAVKQFLQNHKDGLR